MAKYDVTFACGHTGTVNIVGPYKQREKKLQWYEERGLCPDCYQKQKKPYFWVDRTGSKIEIRVYDSYPIKDELKKLGYNFNRESACWYILVKPFNFSETCSAIEKLGAEVADGCKEYYLQLIEDIGRRKASRRNSYKSNYGPTAGE